MLQSQIMKTNVRPGYRVINSSTGFYIDPLTTSKIENE